MTLDKDDLKELRQIISDQFEDKFEKKIGEKFGKNLEKVGELIDNKNYVFLHETITPMLDGLFETQVKELGAVENHLGTRIDNLVDGNARMERKLDQITDMLADRITNHEKRISKIEVAIA